MQKDIFSLRYTLYVKNGYETHLYELWWMR